MPQSEIWSGLDLKFVVSLQSGFMRSFSKFDASDMIIFCFSFLAITMDYVTFKFGVVVQGAVQVFSSCSVPNKKKKGNHVLCSVCCL